MRDLPFPRKTCLDGSHPALPASRLAPGPCGTGDSCLDTCRPPQGGTQRLTFRHRLLLLVVGAARLLGIALQALIPGPLLQRNLAAHKVSSQAQLLLQRRPHQAGGVYQTQVTVPQRPGRRQRRCLSSASCKQAPRSARREPASEWDPRPAIPVGAQHLCKQKSNGFTVSLRRSRSSWKCLRHLLCVSRCWV